MIVYILKFSACLLILQLVYKLLLERESINKFKRFYLLGSVFLALGIPLITFTTVLEPIALDNSMISVPQELTLPLDTAIPEDPVNWLPIVLWTFYSLGVALFTIKFLTNLNSLRLKIKNNPKLKSESYTNVLLQKLKVPFTFFNFIFLNKTSYENNAIAPEVLLHEQAHARQKHTLDILFIELLQIIFWFNPLLHWLKKDIKQNHEYLADSAVVNHGVELSFYQELLLSFSNQPQHPLVNSINYSSIKKRFTIMKTKTSKKRAWLKSLFLVPVIAMLVYGFSQSKTVVKPSAKEGTSKQIEALKPNEGATEAMMQEYKDFIKNFKETRHVINDSYERAVAIYDIMTQDQRDSVEKYPELPNLKSILVDNAMKERASAPTQQLINAWKDKSQYALWIDGKVVENSVLNNAKASDFKHYFQSKVYKNARSERFPQPFQVNIYSEDYYNAHFKNRDIKEYKKLAKNYTDALATWLKGDRTDNSELQILKALADKTYFKISEDRRKQFGLKTTPPLPAVYSPTKIKERKSKLYARSVEVEVINDNSYVIDGISATKKSFLSVFNQLHQDITSETRKRILNIHVSSANKITDETTWFMYNTLKDYGFYRMVTPDQEINMVKGNTPFAIENKTQQKGASKVEIEEYNKIASKYNAALNGKKTRFYETEIERMRFIYNKMTDAQKENAESYPDIPPPPPPPPVKENTKQSFSHSTSYNETSLEDHAKNLIKNDAVFYYRGKRITSNKVLELIKANKDIIISSNTSSTSQKASNVYTLLDGVKDIPPPPPPPPAPKKEKQTIINKKVIVNGKLNKTNEYSMYRKELLKLVLSLEEGEVTKFKLKIPGVKTQQHKGNTINGTSHKQIMEAPKNSYINIFDIKDGKNSKIKPIMIVLKD